MESSQQLFLCELFCLDLGPMLFYSTDSQPYDVYCKVRPGYGTGGAAKTEPTRGPKLPDGVVWPSDPKAR
eukprot:1412000-Amphidinium_carterae.1